VAVIHSIKDQLKQENEASKSLRKDLKEIQDKIKAEKEVSHAEVTTVIAASFTLNKFHCIN